MATRRFAFLHSLYPSALHTHIRWNAMECQRSSHKQHDFKFFHFMVRVYVFHHTAFKAWRQKCVDLKTQDMFGS